MLIYRTISDTLHALKIENPVLNQAMHIFRYSIIHVERYFLGSVIFILIFG